jgi:hypothetical protein
MKHLLLPLFVISSVLCGATGPGSKNFGIGLVLGDPSGVTAKFWQDQRHAIVVDVGNSYYGSPRIDGSYLWHYDAFSSRMVDLHLAAGGVVGFGGFRSWFYYGKDRWSDSKYSYSGVAVGARGAVGINIIPRSTPLEIFVELGAVLSISPGLFTIGEGSIGARYYP